MMKNTHNDKQQAKAIFSTRLKNALKDNQLSHLTYKELGHFFNVTEMAVYKWLNQQGMPAMARLPEIAQKLSISVDYLMPTQFYPINEDSGVYLDDEQQLLNCYRQLSQKQQKLLKSLVEELM